MSARVFAILAAHPHARGDDEERKWRLRRLHRLTPTRVGTTSSAPHSGRWSRLTPTRVGTTWLFIANFCDLGGSPPRAWGRRDHAAQARHGSRLTPTRVGTTLISNGVSSSIAAHPHARGDDALRTLRAAFVAGSPPRAWGRRGLAGPVCLAVPAHPHARGDDVQPRDDEFLGVGSPPRAWGRPEPRTNAVEVHRLTPTRVGTTCLPLLPLVSPSAHPHARGDDVQRATTATTCAGSPPRAWGRQRDARHERAPGRLTPTRVGTTMAHVSRALRSAAHPHARGDDTTRTSSASLRFGSPPRAWGRRTSGASTPRWLTAHPHARGDDGVGRPVGQRQRRLTPTRVGTTFERVHDRGSVRRLTPTRVGTTSMPARMRAHSFGSPPRAWGRRHTPSTPRPRS